MPHPPTIKRNLEDALVFLLQTLDLPTHSIDAAESRLRVMLTDRESVWQLMQDVDSARNAVSRAIEAGLGPLAADYFPSAYDKPPSEGA